jgi:PAS domain S-box-containing protein
LPATPQERLERLRGFASGFGRALTCACSRLAISDGKSAVLVAATEPAGPALTLDERVRRLVAGGTGAFAAFAPDGTLVYANAAAQARLSGATTLSVLGIETLGATALETGTARGTAQLGEAAVDVAAERLGEDASRVILLTLTEKPNEVLGPQRAAAEADMTDSAAAPQAIIAVPAAEAAAAPTAAQNEPMTERRHPLRFVWQMDADGRFAVGSDEFIELVGPRTTAAFGRLWSEIEADLNLDPNHQVARAVATRETWSGIVISWPVDESSDRLPVELSGLPVFDRDRGFRGYRGFGVCRDIARINQLARARRERPIGFMPAPDAATPAAIGDELVPATVAPAAPPSPLPPMEAQKSHGAAATATEPGEAAAQRPDRPALSVTPVSANVVPFRSSPPPEPKVPPVLSPVERRAFRELAQELTSRLRGSHPAPAAVESGAEGAPAEPPEAGESAETAPAPASDTSIEQVLLDRIPIGILVYRHDTLLYANRHFLEWSGYESIDAIAAAGGLNNLFVEPGTEALAETGGAQSLSIMTQRGDSLAVEGRMFTVPWNGSSALALILTNGQAAAGQRTAERALDQARDENRALQAILDAASDGVVTLDRQGRIVTVNAPAAALFGKPAGEMAGRPLAECLAAASERAARDYFDRIAAGSHSLDNSLDIEMRGGDGRPVALAMTLTRIGGDRFCAVFRDATARRQIEEELRNAKREALRATTTKAEFLAKVSHEIRTPLNAMTGFAEVIMAERLGPIGNERYREYLRDIHAAGTHLVAMLNDLLDLSKIETGQIDLSFVNVSLNELTQQCVGLMQPQANRARIIIRTALTHGLPQIVADERSLRQIVLNLLTNSIKFTGPGGQVIVSTVFSDSREAVLRVRDTGVGMSEKDIQAALEPFQQTAVSGSLGSGGSGFGLPLTKALAEANGANFGIKSAPNSGTLVEIAFPPSRIVAA